MQSDDRLHSLATALQMLREQQGNPIGHEQALADVERHMRAFDRSGHPSLADPEWPSLETMQALRDWLAARGA